MTANERLVLLNDALLRPLIEAGDDDERGLALQAILTDVAAPTIRKAIARYARREGGLQPADVEDVTSTVTLRLIRRLRACAELEEQAIERLPDYIAMQTFHAIHDLLRVRFPERSRLKSRIRYVLTHDRRLALWSAATGLAAGMARFRDTDAATEPIAIATPTQAMLERDRPADAIHAILARVGRAVPFDALVTYVAELWNVRDAMPASAAALEIGDGEASAHDRVEARETLGILWSEVRELRERQRAALLLNLRDDQGANGLAQLLVSNVATFDDIASAVGLAPARLAEIWSDLPLDDLTIAGMLGLTRQQVINLRQAARDRLSRRMSRGSRRGRP